MDTLLFHADARTFFDQAAWRAEAAAMLRGAPLLRRAMAGDREAAAALHLGYWPFVREFEFAIDQQTLPRGPLRARFGDAARVGQTITGLARAVREMKAEEGSHAAHWAKDAQHLGLDSLDGEVLPGVRALIDSAYTADLPHFFAVLAGTEFVAEELARLLVHAPGFTQLFDRKRWVWGEIHLMPHEHGPSHLEIDLDLARAYCADDAEAAARIPALVRQTMRMFAEAGAEVTEKLAPTAMAA